MLDRKPWRADLEAWEQRVKPAAIAAHWELRDTDLPDLPDEDLAAHFEECLANSHFAGALHGYFSNAFIAPVHCCRHSQWVLISSVLFETGLERTHRESLACVSSGALFHGLGSVGC